MAVPLFPLRDALPRPILITAADRLFIDYGMAREPWHERLARAKTQTEILEVLSYVDQLDVLNLTGGESACRYLQFCEHDVKKRVDSMKACDGAEYFLDKPRRPGRAIVSLEISKWVVERAQRDSLISKEETKTMEERLPLKGPKK